MASPFTDSTLINTGDTIHNVYMTKVTLTNRWTLFTFRGIAIIRNPLFARLSLVTEKVAFSVIIEVCNQEC